jgi:hypothetical protein
MLTSEGKVVYIAYYLHKSILHTQDENGNTKIYVVILIVR